MAKFNIEIELDWLDEESIDDEIKSEVIAGLQNTITHNVEKEINEKMAEKIEKETERVVDAFLQQLTTKKIEDIQIPTKEDSWSSKVEYVPISEFIGQKFEDMTTVKNLNGKGEKYDRYNDRHSGPYSMIEYLTRNYIGNELNEKVINMIQQAKTQAEQTLIKSLEQNLQHQLNADMLQRLNIPALLEKLQNTISIEGESNEG